MIAESLGARLFRTRLDMLGALDAHAAAGEPASVSQGGLDGDGDQDEPKRQESAGTRPGSAERVLRSEVADLLRGEVAAMNPDANFLVRPHRRLIERFAAASAWQAVDEDARGELARHVAGLPSERDPEWEEAKRFDLLVLSLQLCVLDAAPGFERLRRRVMELASALEAQSSIPAIRAHGALLQDLQTDAWWEGVTASMLETVRKRLRGVMHLIEKSRARIVYTDFADEEGEAVEVAFGAFENPGTFERFRERARLFLRAHEDHVAIGKLRMNRALTPTDLEELERMLHESEVGSPEQIERAKADSAGLGLFVRSLVGLDRAAVQEAFSSFVQGTTMRPNQIEFLEMMIEHLQEHGVMEAGRLYEPPYTDLNERGLDGVFDGADADHIVKIVEGIHRRAAA